MSALPQRPVTGFVIRELVIRFDRFVCRSERRKGPTETDTTRNRASESPSPAQVQSHTEHRATRVHEDGGLTEIRAEEIVRRQGLLRRVIERIEHIQKQLDASS